MPTDQHYTWQIALYLLVALTYGCAVVFVVKARTPLRKWLGASFLITYLENVVTFPAAMLGDERYAWLLGHPDTTRYLSMVLVSVAATLAGFFVFTHRRPRLRLSDAIPPLRASTSSLRLGSMVFSTACAVASIVMSASGYFGYFTATDYWYSPPVWLDAARTVIGIGGGTLFVLLVAAGVGHRRLTGSEWSVTALWSLAGLASGMKSLVMLPFFYILLAAWLTNRFRFRQVALFCASLMVAYAMVEPLRGLRLSVSEDNALEGLNTLVSEDLLTAPDVTNVLSLFLARIDYTALGVEALEADRYGQLQLYRSRLSEAYRSLLALAFLPRAFWPDKPLFDYGRELNIALTGMDTNAITPSGVVASYLWLGYPGVLINAFLLSYLFVCSGRLLTTSLHDPLAYLPVLLLVTVIWTPESIAMARYVSILRAFVAVGLFYLLAGQVGLLRKGGRALRPQGHRPLRPKPGFTQPQPRFQTLHTMMYDPPPTRNGERPPFCDMHSDTASALRPLRLLFVGEAWKGSSARSMREALESLQAAAVSEVDVGHYFPSYRSVVMRGANRLLRPLQCQELEHRIAQLLRTLSPDVFVAYKGWGISRRLVRRMKARGVLTVNVFPDCSPHAHGRGLSRAIGEYDLVVSAKPFHPSGWQRVYGLRNTCVCVPHGYDPAVHYWPTAPSGQVMDVVLAATWRPEYHKLMLDFATGMRDGSWQVGLAGHGWSARRSEFPPHWSFAHGPTGREYGTFLRSGRIAIAPVQREVVVNGKHQPGDEDSTRTYELAAAQCFFVHRRTDYVQTVFDERTEVPLWDDARELVALVRHYLPRERERRMMAAAAHARAVPEYSVPNRAAQVMAHVRAQLAARHPLSP